MYSPSTQLPQAPGRAVSSTELEKSQTAVSVSGDLESCLLQIYHHHHQNSLKLRDQAGQLLFSINFFLFIRWYPPVIVIN